MAIVEKTLEAGSHFGKDCLCCHGAQSMAERSDPTFEVRGRNWEDPMPEGWRPRGVTPRPRSGAEPRLPGCDDAGTAKRS